MDTDEQVKSISFSLDERDLIVGLTSIEIEIETRFKLAMLKNKRFFVEMNAYDLDLLLGDITADANHTKNRTLQKKLQKLYGRLSDTLESEFSSE